MERIPERIDSTFRFVLLAARRAEQLMRGALPRVDNPELKQARVAMREIFADRVHWDYGPPPAPVETAEPEAAASETQEG